MICEMAGRNPDYVQQKIKKVLLRKGGWNVDVPITSHYRTRVTRPYKKRGPKFKGLTGNTYYAAKAKKNLGWSPKVTFKDLVRIMVDAEMEAVGAVPVGEGKAVVDSHFDEWHSWGL